MSGEMERDLSRDLEKDYLIPTVIDVDNERSWRAIYHTTLIRFNSFFRRRIPSISRFVTLGSVLVLLALSVWLYTGHTVWVAGQGSVDDVFNATLGFEKVYVLSLATRTDRRDAIALAARLTGFDFEFVDAVRPEDIADKAIPEGWDFKRENEAVLATWRSHLNLMQKVIHDGTATALILEDDSDWDITFKAQLAQFATGVRLVSSSDTTTVSQDGPLASPYGHDWHLLWPGTCRMSPSDNTTRFYIQPDDQTVTPPTVRNAVWSSPHRPPEAQQAHTRMTFRADGTGMCMYAYAVTQAGAQKMLAQISLRPQRKPIDVLLRNLCRGENAGVVGAFDCYGVYPALVGSHRAEGSGLRDSDNRNLSTAKHPEYTRDVVYSTTLNAGRILAGGDAAEVLAQWPEDATRPSLSMAEDFAAVVGTGSVVDIDMKALPETEMQTLEAEYVPPT